MIFISPADFSINFLKPIDLENKLYYVKLYVYNKRISTLLDKVISMIQKTEHIKILLKTLVKSGSALESIKENLSNDYEMNMVLRSFNL